MSDISIPGVSSKYNTDKIVSDMMKVERLPLTRLQDRVTTIKKQEAGWQDINRNIATVRDAANDLYSFDNPFEDKLATSSDPDTLSATVTRSAQSTTDTIKVDQIASADAFLSRSLPNDFAVPGGTYTFAVGDKKITFQYSGGTLQDFATAINQRAGDLLQASIVHDSASTQVFEIQSKKTGAANTLTFGDDASKFAVDAGILRSTGTTAVNVPLGQTTFLPWTKPLDPNGYSAADGNLTINPGGELSIPISPPVAAQPNLVLEVKVKITDIPHGAQAQPVPPTGPKIPDTGNIQYQNLTVNSAPSAAPLPPYQAPQPPKEMSDLGVLFMSDGSTVVKLPELKDTSDEQTIQVPISNSLQTLSALDVRNNNTYRKITIESVRVYDPNARGQYAPVHPVSQASDAVIDLNGIKVTRPTNNIDDLIPGTTLNLKKPSPNPVALDIAPDTKKVKDAIINFVGDYNKLMTTLEVYTSNDPTVIDEVSYFTDAERKQAHDNLGLFQGDITLQQMKSRLEEYMMDPYPTSMGRNLNLLAQVGVSTDSSKTFSGIDRSKLRGYLEIDEQKLDSALSSELPGVRDLFGYDTNGDHVIDNGAAYMVDHFLAAFNQTGGIIDTKMQSMNQDIAQTNQQIDTLTQQLTQKEQDLKDKYNQMEGTVDQLQQNSKSIEALGGGGSSGGSLPGGP
jgi:flagellar hook-associated protein 2